MSKIFFKILAFLFFINLSFYVPTQKVEALACATCYTIPQGIMDNILQIPIKVSAVSTKVATVATQINTYKAYYKILTGDLSAFKNARNSIEGIKSITKTWLSTGYKGKPLFLTNPDQFFGNLAIDQLALVKRDLLKDLGYANRDIAQQLIKDISSGITPNANRFASQISTDICGGLRKQLVSYQGLSNSEQKSQLVASKQAQISDICSGSAEQKYAKAKNCASDFSCGGWDAILAVTGNLAQNTDSGRLELARAEYEKKLTKETKKRDDELNRGSGALNETKCVKFEKVENREICVKEEVSSPGAAAVSSLDQLIKEPINSLQLINLKGQDSGISSIGGFIGDLFSAASSISSAIGSVRDSVNSVVGSVNGVINTGNDIRSQIENLANGIETLVDGPVANNNQPPTSGNTNPNTQPGNTTNNPSIPPTNTGNNANLPPDTNGIYTISTKDRDELLDLIKPNLDSVLEGNRLSATLVNKELSSYRSVFNSLDQVGQCYVSKVQAQKVLLDRGTIIPTSYILKIPDSVPQYIRDRVIVVNSEMVNLNSVLENGRVAGEAATNIYNRLATTTDSRVFENLKDKLDDSYKNMLDESFWAMRDAKNQVEANQAGEAAAGLYSRLAQEATDLVTDKPTGFTDQDGKPAVTLSALGVCNAIKLVPPTEPINSNGNN